MNSADFCFWLRGYIEMVIAAEKGPTTFNNKQMKCLMEHLDRVFECETTPPSTSDIIHPERFAPPEPPMNYPGGVGDPPPFGPGGGRLIC